MINDPWDTIMLQKDDDTALCLAHLKFGTQQLSRFYFTAAGVMSLGDKPHIIDRVDYISVLSFKTRGLNVIFVF